MLSFVCSAPRWLDVYQRFSVLCTAVTVATTAVLGVVDWVLWGTIDFSNEREVRNEGDVRAAMFISSSVMLALISLHFIVATPVALRNAADKLKFTEFERGSTFDPHSKLLDVKKAASIVCASIVLRTVLLILRSVSSLKQNNSKSCPYCDPNCQPPITIFSRIVENE